MMLAQQVAQRARPNKGKLPTQQPNVQTAEGMVGAAQSGNMPFTQLMPYLQQNPQLLAQLQRRGLVPSQVQ